MPYCFICERRKYKGEQCASCESFFCNECVEAYCDGIQFDSECYACNGDDDDCVISFMGDEIKIDRNKPFLAQHQPIKYFSNSKTHVGERFYNWFVDHKLDTYKTSENNKHHFPHERLIDDIYDFYFLHKQGNKKIIIEHNLNLIYNCIVRTYEPDAFERYMNWIKKTIGKDFAFEV